MASSFACFNVFAVLIKAVEQQVLSGTGDCWLSVKLRDVDPLRGASFDGVVLVVLDCDGSRRRDGE